MSFNLNTWKRETNTFLRPSKFEILVTPPNITGAREELRLRAESVSLPGVAFMSADNIRPYGFGKTFSVPYGYNPTEISCTHTIGEDSEIIDIFNKWTNYIVDYEGFEGNTSNNGVLNNTYSANYLKSYSVPLEIRMYKSDGTPSKRIKLMDAFPSSVDQAQLSWGTADDIVRLNVTYRYTNYTLETF